MSNLQDVYWVLFSKTYSPEQGRKLLVFFNKNQIPCYTIATEFPLNSPHATENAKKMQQITNEIEKL